MTEADVRELMTFAVGAGRDLAEYDARVVLGAKEVLKAEPNNQHAIAVLENFDQFMATGIQKPCFAEFLLPTPRTDEAHAEIERQVVQRA